MITIDELKVQLADYAKAVKDLEEALAIEASRKRVQELEHTMSRPGFYDDADLSKKVFDEVGDLKGKLSRFEKLQGLYDDAETMLVMLDEEYDPDMVPEAEEAVNAVGKAVDELQLMTMLNGEYDHSNAILTFHAGTGGTEAQDWAEMLYRMYNKWAVAHGMTVEVLDYQDGDEAGLKSASMMVKGANAYGLLKSENGVHRLVRVSPFDANARRQTSFASLEVMPELDNTIQVDIRPEDIEMQVYRSSGAGGQHINKTSSAVRLIHKPTGVVVSCQTQRSQFQNRDYAMEMLKAKLYQIAKQQHMDKIDDIKGVQNEIAWGHQIRSYVFMPYTMVKDHRTNYETGNVDAVMDGDLQEILDKLQVAENAERLRGGESQNGPCAGRVAAADHYRQVDPLRGGDDQHEPYQRARVVEQRAAEGEFRAEGALHPVVEAAGIVPQGGAVLGHHEGIGHEEQQRRQDQDRDSGVAHLIIAPGDVVEGKDLHNNHEDNVLNA